MGWGQYQLIFVFSRLASNKPRRHWQVDETRWNFETLTGKLMATSHSIPGFSEFLLSHSHAVYYSPSQWCSVGYVIHNVRFPNLKQISYGVMGIALRFISTWHRVTDSFLRPSLKLFSGINFQIVHNCDKKCRLIVVFQILDIIILKLLPPLVCSSPNRFFYDQMCNVLIFN